MVERLGIDRSIISDLGNLLYKNYGTTMAGLRVCFFYLGGSFSLLVYVDFYLDIDINEILFLQAIGYDFDYDEYHR